jgi:hypothetical protein
MIQRSKQSWHVGDTVKVGFMGGLTVTARIPTPGDYAPDQYELRSKAGVMYRFTPHLGIQRIS